MEMFKSRTMGRAALLYCLVFVDAVVGRSAAVTESSVMTHVSDYQYEDIPSNPLPKINVTDQITNKTNTIGKEATEEDSVSDGLFYPLYGEVLDRMSSQSGGDNHESEHPTIGIPPKTDTRNQPAIRNFPDYATSMDETSLPNGMGVNALNSDNGMVGRQFWGGDGEGGMTAWFRGGYRVPEGGGAWTANGMRMGDDDRRWGGEAMETLRKEFQVIRRFGLVQRLDQLQVMYPQINVTRLYNHYQQHAAMPMAGGQLMYGNGEWDEGGGSIGYWTNGTFHYYNTHPGYYGSDEGFWYNGTFYPEMEREAEDGFWYNGTYYPGEMDGPDLEDGYFYNGTYYYYPGEAEGPELEDGFFYNGTFYPGEQEVEEGGLGYEREDLMWWQLHHPRWQDRTNNVERSWNQVKWPPGFKDARGKPVHPYFFSTNNQKAAPFLLHAMQPAGYPVAPWQRTSMEVPFPVAKPQMTSTSKKRTPLGLRGQTSKSQQQQQQQQQLSRQRGQIHDLRKTNIQRAATPRSPWQEQQKRVSPGVQAPAGQMAQNSQPQQAQRLYGTPPRSPMSQTRRHTLRPYRNPSPQNPYNTNNGRRRPFPPPPMSNMRPPYNRNMRPVEGSNRFPGSITVRGRQQAQAIKAGAGPNTRPFNNQGANSPSQRQTPQHPPPVNKKSSPLDPYRDTTTAAIGIIFACVLGLTLILAPLLCMLHNYRQSRRMKKRTFLKRPELSGSVDEGLLDAMVRTELGAVGGGSGELGSSSTARDDMRPPNRKGEGSVHKVKAKVAELAEKRRKEGKGWSKGRRAESGLGREEEREGRREIEMREMGRSRADGSFFTRPLPALPQSDAQSSFLVRHNLYKPGTTLSAAREELRGGQGERSTPMSVVGMDSEDEQQISVVGK